MSRTITVIGIRSVLAILILGLLMVVLGFGFPTSASAAEAVSVQTAQLLPPGSNNMCGQLSVSGFTPYIYNGALHGFEFSVADSSYVAIAGSAGDTSIPFNQMTRRIEPSGSLRVHADIATTPIRGSLTVTVTMLSAKAQQQVVCISILSTTMGEDGTLGVAPMPAPRPIPSPVPAGPSSASGGGAKVTPTPSPSAPKTTVTTTNIKATATPVATTKNILTDMCTAGGASRLWFILLAIYAVIVAAAVFGQPQLPAAIRSQEWVAAAIVVPFLLLFGLWYFAESCRISAWVPAIATLIALAGLGAAFWDRGSSGRVINLPGAKT